MSVRRRLDVLVYLAPLTLATAFYLPGVFFRYWLWDGLLYSAITLRITRTGEWWTLMESNSTYFNKPPLAFWLHALFVWALGEADWVLRLPSVLAALACIALTVSIVKRLHGLRAGLVAGLLLALCDEYILRIAMFRIDFPLTALMLSGVRLCIPSRTLARDGTTAAQPRRASPALWIMLAGIPVGLSLLTKPMYGLVTLVLVGIWIVTLGSRDRRLARWVIAASLLAVLIAAPWHVSMILRHGNAFTQCYFIRQSVSRAIGETMRPEPWYWYLRYLVQSEWPKDAPFALGPVHHVLWLIPVAGAIVRFIRRRRLSTRSSSHGVRLAVIWTLGLFVILSAFGDKRGQYLFPIYPGLAWLGALWVVAVVPRRLSRLMLRLATPAAVLVLLAIVALRPDFLPRIWRPSDMTAFTSFVAANPHGDYWDASLYKFESADIYIRTGVWPKMIEDLNTGEQWEPPKGAFVFYDLRHSPRPSPTDEVILADERFVMVRRGDGLILRAPPPKKRKR